jgi:hypothetical protein
MEFLAHCRAPAQSISADALESRVLADPRQARQLAQAFAVARRTRIALPTAEERRVAGEEVPEQRRAMAKQWARTCAQEEAPAPRRWRARRGLGRLPARTSRRAEQTDWIDITSWRTLNRTRTCNRMYIINYNIAQREGV